jgi:hypothetical protein
MFTSIQQIIPSSINMAEYLQFRIIIIGFHGDKKISLTSAEYICESLKSLMAGPKKEHLS